MIAPVTHILPLVQIRRARMLPGKGRVLARVGQKVNAADIIAESDVPGAHTLIDVRRILGLRRTEMAHRLMERKAGERVEKGDILAQTGGLLSKVIRAPVDGQIVAIQRGQVLLERAGTKFELKAGLTGTVTEVLPERGVIIESSGSLIQGVWGNGQINLGMLHCLAKQPDDELTRSDLDMSLRGSVVLGGWVEKSDTLIAADELPLRGLILGSMSSDLVPVALKINCPVVLIEGFGRIPMNASAFKLLTTNEKRDVSIDASWDAIRGDRPEIVIPLPAQGQPPHDMLEFNPGQTVRMIVPPHAGQIGTLLSLRPGLTALPNGVRVPCADIRLENSQVVIAPLANLDVLE